MKDIRRLAKIYILCDGYDEIEDDGESDDKTNEKQKRKDGTKRGRVTRDVASRYREHLKLLRAKIDQPPFAGSASGFDDSSSPCVEIVELPERHGSACAIKEAFDMGLVTTPFVMVAQHDNFFVSDVDLPFVLEILIDNDWIKCFHFISTATMDYVTKIKRRYDIDLEPFVRQNTGNLKGSVIPLLFWYGRTAISRTDYYTDFVLKERTLRVGDHLEELLGEKQLRDIQERGVEAAHSQWGNFVLDQGREVIYHLSGRRVRAADPNKESVDRSDRDKFASSAMGVTNTLPGKAPTDESCGSFTTARSVRAIVPGLEIIPSERKDGGARGKFKQKCFLCGKKGHSYRFCPDAREGNQPVVETIGL